RAHLVDVVDHQRVGQAGGPALLTAVDRPDQGPVGGVELIDARLLLDDRGTVEPDPGLRRDDHVRAQAGRDAHAPDRADWTGDDTDDRSQRTQLQQGRADLRDGVEAEVGL